MSSMASRLASPRFQRRMLWVGGSVLVAGTVAAIASLVWTGPAPQPTLVATGAVRTPVHQKAVPLDQAAKKVGERFIETAVERRQLAQAYKLVTADLRQGMTLKQWETGNIPVVPYPADTSSPAPTKIEWSHQNDVMLLVLLTPRHGIKAKPQLFHIGLHAYGTGKARHWLVYYWVPFGAPKIPLG